MTPEQHSPSSNRPLDFHFLPDSILIKMTWKLADQRATGVVDLSDQTRLEIDMRSPVSNRKCWATCWVSVLTLLRFTAEAATWFVVTRNARRTNSHPPSIGVSIQIPRSRRPSSICEFRFRRARWAPNLTQALNGTLHPEKSETSACPRRRASDFLSDNLSRSPIWMRRSPKNIDARRLSVLDCR